MRMQCLSAAILAAAFSQLCFADGKIEVPMRGAAEAAQAFEAILAQGEPAVAEICSRIVPPGTGNDTEARFLAGGLAFHAGRPDAKRQRLLVAGVFIKSLNVATNSDVQDFFLEQLRLCGGPESVAPAARFLSSEALCHPAAAVLQSVGGREAEEALLDGLRKATNGTAAHMALALGALRSRRALEELTRRAGDPLPAVSEAAVAALANLGEKSSGTLLRQRAEDGKSRAGSLLWLAWARRRHEDGDRRNCEEVCKCLLAAPNGNVRAQALNLLADAESGLAAQALLAALADPDPAVAGAATARLAELRGRSVGREVLARLKDAAPERRPGLIGVLGRRGDDAALPALAAELRHADEPVRLAAIEACARIGGSEAAGMLLGILTNASPTAVESIVHGVATMKGRGIDETLVAGLSRLAVSEKTPRIRILALRRATAHAPAVAAAVADSDPAVRAAAVQALGELGGEAELDTLLPRALSEADETARARMREAVVKMARRIPDGVRRAAPFRAALARADAAGKIAVLKILPEVGGGTVCGLVASVAREAPEPDVKEAAVRALTEWPDAAAADPLLAMAGSLSDVRERVLAIRAVTRLARLRDLPAKDSVAIFRRLLPLASRAEEQTQILGALAQVQSRDALLLAAGCLEKPELREAAGLCIARIAAPPRGKRSVATPADVPLLNRAAEALGSGEWYESLRKLASSLGGKK